MMHTLSIHKSVELSGHEAPVYALETLGDKKAFYSGSGDRVVCKWQPDLDEQGAALVQTLDTVYSLCHIKKNNQLVIGCSNGSFHVVDLAAGKEIRLIQHHKAGIFDMVYSDKLKRIFTASADGTIAVWEAESFKLLYSLPVTEGKVRSLSLHPDQELIAVSGGDGRIRIFETERLKLISEFTAHQTSVNAVRYHPQGHVLFSGGHDAHLNCWDAKSFKSLEKIPAHNYAIYSIAFSPDARWMATGSRDKTVKVWNPENNKLLLRLDAEKYSGHRFSVNTVCWWDNSRLLSAGDDKKIIVWKLEEQ